jgi:shikimate kinase
MKRVLITGMSGTGKSAVVRERAARGYPAVDLDTPEWSEWVDADPADALTPQDGKDCCGEKIPFASFRRSINQEDCFPLIELIVLLSVPMEVIMKRLEARSPDGYADTYQERQKVSGLISTIEPLLRDCADHEIDTTRPVDATVDEILRVT